VRNAYISYNHVPKRLGFFVNFNYETETGVRVDVNYHIVTSVFLYTIIFVYLMVRDICQSGVVRKYGNKNSRTLAKYISYFFVKVLLFKICDSIHIFRLLFPHAYDIRHIGFFPIFFLEI